MRHESWKTNFSKPYLANKDENMRRLCEHTSAECTKEWLRETQSMARATTQQGVSLIIVSPLPDFRSLDSSTPWNTSKETCTKQWFRPSVGQDCFMSRTKREILLDFKEIRTGLARLQSEFDNVFIYDPLPLVCPSHAKICSNYLGDKKIYVDTNHLNYFGAKLISSDFSRFLLRNRIVNPSQ